MKILKTEYFMVGVDGTGIERFYYQTPAGETPLEDEHIGQEHCDLRRMSRRIATTVSYDSETPDDTTLIARMLGASRLN